MFEKLIYFSLNLRGVGANHTHMLHCWGLTVDGFNLEGPYMVHTRSHCSSLVLGATSLPTIQSLFPFCSRLCDDVA